ncbi:MAG: sigma-70 family RNA polymerase sigma factor [Bacteroidetes bacterium]|nr:sigma-70 family RNA polymerase sigma factor [Bacteroidota bacterium]
MARKTDYTNSELITMLKSKAQQDQNTALNFIYQTFYPSVLVTLLKKGIPKEKIENCFQDAIIQTMLKIRKGEEVRNLKGYLWTIIRTQVFNNLETTETLEIVRIPDNATTKEFENTQLLDFVKNLFHNIKGNCWEVFELRYYSSTWEEIANILNESRGAAIMRYRRCIKDLISWMENRPRLKEELLTVLKHHN